MKKVWLILTIFFLTLVVAKGQTNVYQPFPNDSAIWGYVSQDANGATTYSVILWLGDTVINSTIYKKQFNNSSYNPFSVFSGLAYTCGIRQDIPNEKIYKIINGVETDISISQNLQVGDTTLPIFRACPSWPYRIVSIDSIQLGNKFHKRYNCQEDNVIPPLGTESYIVGVGEQSYAACWEGTSGLTCFSVNNVILYGSASPYCPQLVSINNYKQFESDLVISPNPFCFSTTLETDKPFKNATFTVYNLHGQKVKQLKNISEHTVTFYRDNLPSGLYFILFTTDDKIFSTHKLVIIDE